MTNTDAESRPLTDADDSGLESTGQFEDHFVADLPEPKLEWHRYPLLSEPMWAHN